MTDEERNSIRHISSDIRTLVYLRNYCKCAIDKRNIKKEGHDENLQRKHYEVLCTLAKHIAEMFGNLLFARPDEKQNMCFIQNHPYNLTLSEKYPISPSVVVLDAENLLRL